MSHATYMAPSQEALREAFPKPSSRKPGEGAEPRPFEGESSYHHDYHKYDIGPAEPVVEPPQRPAVPFEGESSYHHEYTKKPIPPIPKNSWSPKPSLPFSGESMSHATYMAPSKEALREAFPKPSSRKPEGAEPRPFEGESSYHHDYHRYNIGPAEPVVEPPQRPAV